MITDISVTWKGALLGFFNKQHEVSKRTRAFVNLEYMKELEETFQMDWILHPEEENSPYPIDCGSFKGDMDPMFLKPSVPNYLKTRLNDHWKNLILFQ